MDPEVVSPYWDVYRNEFLVRKFKVRPAQLAPAPPGRPRSGRGSGRKVKAGPKGRTASCGSPQLARPNEPNPATRACDRAFAWIRLACLALAAWIPPAAAQTPPASTAQVRIVSPEVGTDHRVTFRLLAPNATEVSVSGEFMEGSKALERNAEGLWSATIGPVEPEIYYYNFTVDGVRTIDPGNPNVKTGSTADTIQSMLEVRGDRPAFYDAQPVPHGEIRTHWYQSRSLNMLRRLTVYVPPGYESDGSIRLPVLYLLHGANGDETIWTRLGHANLILDNLLAAGKTRPFLVVMPFGYGVMPGSASPRGENTALFTRDLLEDVIPYIDSRYRTRADRDDRAIIGQSMGGGQSLSIGLNHLELFSYVGGFSAGLSKAADFEKTYSSLIADPAGANNRLRLLWIGCGRDDSLFGGSRKFSDFLTENRIRHTFRETGGAHAWMVWRRYLNEVSPLLFR
jgi:enterochelin esterase-like enzyme